MSIDLHTIVISPGSTLLRQDRIIIGMLRDVLLPAGTGAGVAVVLPVTTLRLPPAYGVQITPNGDATCYVTAKTTSGFIVTVNPRLASATLPAITIDILVYA